MCSQKTRGVGGTRLRLTRLPPSLSPPSHRRGGAHEAIDVNLFARVSGHFQSHNNTHKAPSKLLRRTKPKIKLSIRLYTATHPLYACGQRFHTTMTAPLPKRIIKETERLQSEPVPGISATPHDDNARYFDVQVDGPGGSCYEGTSTLQVHLLHLPSPIRTVVFAPTNIHTNTSNPCRRRLQPRALSARRLPHVPTPNPLPHTDLPPQHRPPRQDLLGRAEE